MSFANDMDTFVSSFEERARAFVFGVEVVGIADPNSPHKLYNSPLRALTEEEVKMVRHKNKTEYLYDRFSWNVAISEIATSLSGDDGLVAVDNRVLVVKFVEIVDESNVVAAIEKNGALVHTPIVYMVDFVLKEFFPHALDSTTMWRFRKSPHLARVLG